MELRLGWVTVFLGFLADQDEFAHCVRVGAASLEEIAQVQRTLLIFIRASPGSIPLATIVTSGGALARMACTVAVAMTNDPT